ncbi:MAG: hypothetical protein F4X99_19300 [Gammaproteobacteria bacterium]|nr:hypothetical protein [Gammaproteobacteria bacterium]
MSDDWFNKSYRSEARPPAELDARVLAGARRATRRWGVPLAAAAGLTVVVALVFAAMLASVELEVPPESERPPPDRPPVVLDLPGSTGEGPRRGVRAPSPALSASPHTGPCPAPNVLVGPLGGPGRQDRATLCQVGGLLRVEVVWDGEAACPSELSMPVSADTPVALERNALRVGLALYRCEDGDWAREPG